MDAVQEGIDTLASLEQRITRAVELVTSLRSENDRLQSDLKTTQEQLRSTKVELDEASGLSAEFQKDNANLQLQITALSQELDELRGERKQVKARIEKLLGQMDLLSVS
jgi:chromosome segregation ATPase